MKRPQGPLERGLEEGNEECGHFWKFGARAEQVGEHLGGPSALFIFEYECYPEAKILSGEELQVLYREFRSWLRVAEVIGSSEAFARLNAKNSKA